MVEGHDCKTIQVGVRLEVPLMKEKQQKQFLGQKKKKILNEKAKRRFRHSCEIHIGITPIGPSEKKRTISKFDFLKFKFKQ